jgi:hypothetical protein
MNIAVHPVEEIRIGFQERTFFEPKPPTLSRNHRFANVEPTSFFLHTGAGAPHRILM